MEYLRFNTSTSTKTRRDQEKGTCACNTLSSTIERLVLAKVIAMDERELKELEDFIIYKDKCVKRRMDVLKNLEVILKTKDFIKY